MQEKYKYEQPFAYQILMNEINNNSFSHAYIIENNGYNDSLGFAIDFAKTLFCVDNTNNKKVANLIDENNFPDLKIIDPEGLMIKKEEVDNLQIEFSKKPVFGDKKIYIINNAERLNVSASNSILKFLEEPEANIIAILVTNNIYEILETIISRCQIISLKESFKDMSELDLNNRICQSIYKNEIEINQIFEDNTENLLKCIDFVNYYEKYKLDTMTHVNNLWFNFYKTKEQFDIAFSIIILYYVDVLRFLCGNKLNIFFEYEENIKNISQNISIENVCQKIQILTILVKNVKANNNLNLVIDKLLIEFGRCDNLV